MNKLILTLLSFALYATATAQCQASFTYTVNNGSVDFTNTSSGGGLFNSWNFGDGGSSFQSDPSYTYVNTGNYVVCLTIFDSLSQCQSIYCDSIYVVADTLGTGCNLVSNATSNSGTITGSASGATSYDWIVYDASWNFVYNTANPNFNYTPGSNGLYNICITAYDSQQNYCDSTCYTVSIIDSTGGGCNFSSSAAVDANGALVGTASGASAFQWIVYDNSWSILYNTNNSNLNYSPTTQGTFNVCVVAYDSLQMVCDTVCYSLVSDSLASTSFQEEIVFNVYPNPTQGIVNIELSNDEITTIVLIDITGAVILEKEIHASQTEINLEAFPKGLYFIHALGRKGQRLSSSKVLRH